MAESSSRSVTTFEPEGRTVLAKAGNTRSNRSARTIRVHLVFTISLLAPLVQMTSKFPVRVAGPTNVLPRRLRIAFRHLDIRVAQDPCQLVKIAN